jgi:hypothetical protein
MSTSVATPFDGSGAQNGSQIDIDSDGDLDIGAAPNGGQANTFFIAASNTPESNGIPIPGANPAAEEFLIGTMTFTVGSSTGGPQTFIEFIRRRNPGNPGSNNVAYSEWTEDGVARNGLTPYTVNGCIVGPLPEPSTAALVSLASLSLLGRRRRDETERRARGYLGNGPRDSHLFRENAKWGSGMLCVNPDDGSIQT